jgi:DnaK suppressor protein
MTIGVDRFRLQLQDERARVVSAIDNLRHENSGSMADEVDEPSGGNHMADSASVTVDREMDYSLEENEERVLAAIDAALARIENGTYGRCERCGQQIEEKRLEALPYATLCIDDKRRDERG